MAAATKVAPKVAAAEAATKVVPKVEAAEAATKVVLKVEEAAAVATKALRVEAAEATKVARQVKPAISPAVPSVNLPDPSARRARKEGTANSVRRSLTGGRRSIVAVESIHVAIQSLG